MSNVPDEIACVIGGMLLGVLLSMLIFGTLNNMNVESYQSKAVELGAATWVVDPKTGKTTFTWKEKGK